MKILIFNTLYYPNQKGGAERSTQLLAEGLLKAGDEPVVVCTSNKDYVDYVNGVKVYYVKTTNLYWSYDAKEQKSYKKLLWHLVDSYNPFTQKIEKIFDNEKPEVVHTNNLAGFSVAIWKLAKDKGIKIVHTLRDYYLLCPKSTMFKNNKTCKSQCFTCKLYSIPKKEFSKYVDEVVGISQFILSKHKELGHFKNAKKSVIYNSIEIPHNFIKEKNSQTITFGYVGSLSPSKGIELLLDVFTGLNLKNTKLYIYGKGITKNYEDTLRQKFENDMIVFQGFQKPENIYKHIDILVVPSLWNEPFGRIVPEANSYGIPVLVSNNGGLPELVKDGKNGYIFDPNLNGDFEKKLQLIIEMHQHAAFEFDLSNYMEEKVINYYQQVYMYR